MTAKITVIVSGSSAGDCLPSCLDEISEQSFKEIEVLCVDNKKEADKQPDARAEGKYVFFWNPALLPEKNMLEEMYLQAEKTKAGICIGRGISEMEAQEYVCLFCPEAEGITVMEKPLFEIREKQKDPGSPYPGFFEGLRTVRSALRDAGSCPALERSFVNGALHICLMELDRQKDQAAYGVLCETLKKELFYRLGILGHSGGFFYSREDFFRMIRIMEQAPEQLWKRKTEEKIPLKTEMEPEGAETDRQEKMLGSPKISVIMPVYNVEAYLEEALNSLMGQSLKEIEMICINDGSTDGSLEILERYQERDPRIRVFSKENGGLSTARNYGIKKASGKYVYFMDSDDRIHSQTLETCFYKAEEQNLDMVLFSAELFFEKEDLKDSFRLDYRRRAEYPGVMPGGEFFRRAAEAAEFKPSVCLYLLKRELLDRHQLSFYKGIVHEDNLFTIQCLLLADRVLFVNRDFYQRRIRENSIMTGEKKMYRAYSYFVVLRELESFLEKGAYKENRELYAALLMQMVRIRNLACEEIRSFSQEELQAEAERLPYGTEFYLTIGEAAQMRKKIGSVQDTCYDEKSYRYKTGFELEAEQKRTRKMQAVVCEQSDRISRQDAELQKFRDTVRELQETKQELASQLKGARKREKELLESRSYKIGKLITFVPGKIKKQMKQIGNKK